MFDIKLHKVPQLGWFEVKLEKDVIDYLWKIINKSTKVGESFSLQTDLSFRDNKNILIKNLTLQNEDNFFEKIKIERLKRKSLHDGVLDFPKNSFSNIPGAFTISLEI